MKTAIAQIIETVSAEFQLNPEMILSRTRIGDSALARQVVMVMLHRKGLTAHRIGIELGRNHGSVLHGFKAVKNLRETDQHFDAAFRRIESEFKDMPSIYFDKSWQRPTGDLEPPYYF